MRTEPQPGKRAAQGRATRDNLVEVATRLFAERGYEDTTIEDVEGRVMAGLEGLLADAPSAASALHSVALGWLEAAGDPAISRIMLIDAPSVLGWERWRLAGGQALEALRALLEAVAEEGHLTPGLINPYAHMILAALDELALMIAQAEDPVAAMAESRAAVEELLRRLTTTAN